MTRIYNTAGETFYQEVPANAVLRTHYSIDGIEALFRMQPSVENPVIVINDNGSRDVVTSVVKRGEKNYEVKSATVRANEALPPGRSLIKTRQRSVKRG